MWQFALSEVMRPVVMEFSVGSGALAAYAGVMLGVGLSLAIQRRRSGRIISWNFSWIYS